MFELLESGAEGIGYLLNDRLSDLDELSASVRRVRKAAPSSTRRSSPSWSTDSYLETR